VSMTRYWDSYRLDCPMQWPRAMAIVMMSSEKKPPFLPPRHGEAHTMLGDVIAVSVCHSYNDLHWVRVTTSRLNGTMPAIREVELLRTVLHWMFLLSVFLPELLCFFGSRPSTFGDGMGFYHLQR